MKFKKTLAGLLTVVVAISGMGISSMSAIPSSAATVLLGDANNDKSVTAADALCIQQYLKGNYHVTRKQLTSMDINQDYIIDNKDVTYILYKIANGQSFQTTSKTLYNLPEDTTTTYCKHVYNSSNSDDFVCTTYTIQGTTTTTTTTTTTAILDEQSNLFEDYDIFDALQTESSLPSGVTEDTVNKESLRLDVLRNGAKYHDGSCFAVGSHIVATAAHLVYSSSSGFIQNLCVTAYSDNNKGTSESLTANVINIHVPYYYINPDSSHQQVNYDYALLYVDEDLSDYVVNIGVMTNQFMDSSLTDIPNKKLTVSGFTGYVGAIYRYKCEGEIDEMDSLTYEKPYRFHNSCNTKGGQSGGMTYFESKYNYNNTSETALKSVVGINTHGVSGSSISYGVRMTPRLLRFYFQNSNLS